MKDSRFDRLLRMSYGCILIEATGIMLDLEIVQRISETYRLPVRREALSKKTLHGFLDCGFNNDGERHEFLAHLVVEHEIHERNETSPVPMSELPEFAVPLH